MAEIYLQPLSSDLEPYTQRRFRFSGSFLKKKLFRWWFSCSSWNFTSCGAASAPASFTRWRSAANHHLYLLLFSFARVLTPAFVFRFKQWQLKSEHYFLCFKGPELHNDSISTSTEGKEGRIRGRDCNKAVPAASSWGSSGCSSRPTAPGAACWPQGTGRGWSSSHTRG